MELMVFVYRFCDTKTNEVVTNRENYVGAMMKKLNCSAFGVIIHCTHTIIFVIITWHMTHQNITGLCLSLVFASWKEQKYVPFLNIRAICAK